MGLLTGFSIISGVEIVYFALKIGFHFFKKTVWEVEEPKRRREEAITETRGREEDIQRRRQEEKREEEQEIRREMRRW